MESGVMVEKPRQSFDKVIIRLRRAASVTSDLGLSFRALTVVASVTEQDGDVRLALEKAHQPGHCPLKAETLAVLVKILAKARKFPWARNVAVEMSGIDTYQCAIARIWIARFSGAEDDVEAVDDAISKILAPYAHAEAKHDKKALLSKRHHHTGARNNQLYEHLMILTRALTGLKGFEDAHLVSPQHTSAYFYHEASLAISWFFADLMDR